MSAEPMDEFIKGMERLFRPAYYYRLNDQGEPVECKTFAEWLGGDALGFSSTSIWGDSRRVVARTEIGTVQVCTDFMPMRMDWGEKGPPVVWETMTFGQPCDCWQRRCAGGREQAEAMHETVCAEMRAALAKLSEKP